MIDYILGVKYIAWLDSPANLDNDKEVDSEDVVLSPPSIDEES